MTPEQTRALQRHADGHRRAYLAHADFEFDLLVKHVDSLLAQARADAFEECEKICVDLFNGPGGSSEGYEMNCAHAIKARKDA